MTTPNLQEGLNGERTEFPAFPYKPPYGIQTQLMTQIYSVLDHGNVGILESPTGTGKTLSVISSTLQWLMDEDQRLSVACKPKASSGGFDWITEQSHEIQMETNKREAIEEAKRRNKPKFKRRRAKQPVKATGEDAFLVAPYSEKEAGFGGDEYSTDSDDDLADVPHRKVFFASRTHSQLSQFVSELRKAKFTDINGKEVHLPSVVLASRKVMCVNPDVNKLQSSQTINDRCLDLQDEAKGKGSSKKKKKVGSSGTAVDSAGCPWRNKKEESMKPDISAHYYDIEDMIELGKKRQQCPYYSARGSILQSKLVLLPYQSLLDRHTRQALGIELANSILVIDEAHNLMDTLNNMSACTLRLADAKLALFQLQSYKGKYQGRMNVDNITRVSQILRVIQKFIDSFTKPNASHPSVSGAPSRSGLGKNALLHKIDEYLTSLDIANINLFGLERYFEVSDICNKVRGFTMAAADAGEVAMNTSPSSTRVSALERVRVFLRALTNVSGDGRVIITPAKPGDPSVSPSAKFILLNPGAPLQEVVDAAHSIVLVGGTMSPMQEIQNTLFSQLAPGRKVVTFSCNHVVRPTQVSAVVVQQGRDQTFNFTYARRSSKALIRDLGHALCDMIPNIPGGTVIFFPSFAYEDTVFQVWSQGILSQLTQVTKVFREPRAAADVDKILSRYTRTIEEGGRALLTSVVGGKMSEGINFQDDLARAVIMVGLPFPNKEDPELKERITYLERKRTGAGSEYYENLCMRAVNQSVGRAIRHIGDYACVLFCDERYAQGKIVRKLPKWLTVDMKTVVNSQMAGLHLQSFFASNRPPAHGPSSNT